jgi:hypothetical protein
VAAAQALRREPPQEDVLLSAALRHRRHLPHCLQRGVGEQSLDFINDHVPYIETSTSRILRNASVAFSLTSDNHNFYPAGLHFSNANHSSRNDYNFTSRCQNLISGVQNFHLYDRSYISAEGRVSLNEGEVTQHRRTRRSVFTLPGHTLRNVSANGSMKMKG